MLLCLILALARVPTSALTRPVLMGGVIISIWACVQALGLETALSGGRIQWQHAQGFADRVFASFGNPVNLGNWLGIALVYLLTQLPRVEDAVAPRWIIGLACGLIALALCLTGARAAIIGALLGAIVVVWPRLQKSRRLVVVGAFLGVAALLSTLPGRSASLQARFELWQSVTSAQSAPLRNTFGQSDPQPSLRFWLGYGQDLQSVPLSSQLAQAPGQFADRAHNSVLDVWLSTGVLGIISTLLLIGSVARLGGLSHDVLAVAIAAAVAWSVSFGLSADKSLFALILGAQWQTQPEPAPALRAWFAHSLSLAALLFCWLSYRPLPYSAAASDYAAWRKPEQAIAYFRRGQTIYATDPTAAAEAFGRAQSLSPWRSDLARARQQANDLGEFKQ